MTAVTDARKSWRPVGAVLAQDEASSVVWGMPGAVAEAGLCRQILDLSAISPAIHKILGGAMT